VRRISAVINPFRLSSLDEHFASVVGDSSDNDLLRDLSHFESTDGSVVDTRQTMKARYGELTPYDQSLFAVPYETQMHFRLVLPLQSAKVSYVLGHDIGCISSAGIVGEMATVLQFEITPLGHGSQALTPVQQKAILGETIERLSQSRRINILEAITIWPKEVAETARELAQIRNRYLHRYSVAPAAVKDDAVNAYRLAASLLSALLRLSVKEGSLVFLPDMDRYLSHKGVIYADEQSDELWSRIVAHQGETFRQIRGGEFTYIVKGNAVYPDRTNRHIYRKNFEKALRRAPFANTVPLQDLQAPSYVYAIMTDPRIGGNVR